MPYLDAFAIKCGQVISGKRQIWGHSYLPKQMWNIEWNAWNHMEPDLSFDVLCACFFRQCRHVHLLRVIIWYSHRCFQKWAYKPSRSWFFTMVRGNLMDNFSWTCLFLSEVPVLHRDLKQPKKLLVKVVDLVRSICLNYAQSKSALQHLQRLTIEPYHFKTWLMLTAQVYTLKDGEISRQELEAG